MPPVSPPVRPVAALTVALAVAFGALATFVAHGLELQALNPLEFHALIVLGCAASIPITRLASAAPSRSNGHEPSRLRAFSITIVCGALVGLVAQAFTISVMVPRQTLWLSGISLGTDPWVWLALGAATGALVSLVGVVLVAAGLAHLRRSPFVHDAEERFGVPALCLATMTAACVLFVLGPSELAGGVAVVGLGLGFLIVMLLRDVRRVAFVQRAFAGAEPDVEVRAEASDAELTSLFPLADVMTERVLADRSAGPAYRSAARGRGLMLLASSADETLAPVRRRMQRAVGCAGLVIVACVARGVLLAADCF